METPKLTKYGNSVEEVKTAFVTALFEKNETDALYWAYELYNSNLQYESFHLLNDIYYAFYFDKYADYFDEILQNMAVEWEDSGRTKHTVIGSIIKNLVHCDISLTDLVRASQIGSPIIDVLVKNIDVVVVVENKSFHLMGEEELEKLNKKYKKTPKTPNAPKAPKTPNAPKIANVTETAPNPAEGGAPAPAMVKSKIIKIKTIRKTNNIPICVCEFLHIEPSPETMEYMPYVQWCNIYEKQNIRQKVTIKLRRNRR
jgi:hypothetical protein